ncbi:MAG: NAD(P)/FAD-dependent oxidoreductase [Ignavibacteriales bacterium]|nr:MAG: NAD(P)/FAD-dependent oxidoreductase [Ignavibacteriales bacterium]
MRINFDIGIIGAGPAGSTAAAYLASYGFEICLYEKKIFPRETLCVEFLSHEVIHLLKEQNLFDKFISLNPNKINSFRLFNKSGESLYSKFEFEAFGLTRSLFDNLLLTNAIKKGVAVYQPAEVKEIINRKDFYEIIIENDGRIQKKIHVKHLIAAYGRKNPLDNFFKRRFTVYKSKLNGIKFHLSENELTNILKDEIHIYTGDKIYCGVNIVNNNKVTFCFLEKRVTGHPPPRKQLIELQEKNKAFKKLFKTVEKNIFDEVPVYGTGNIYFGKRNLIEDGVFMIGDAAGVIVPLAGDGIGIAMESGKLIADLFNKKRKENLADSELRNLYQIEWNNLFLKRIGKAKVIQNIIMNKFYRGTGFQLCKLFPALMPYFVKSTRNIPGKR